MSARHTGIATTAKGVLGVIQVATEEPRSDEVLIRVECTAVIPPEVYMVDTGFLISSYPVILGFTAAGTVIKVGSDIKDLKSGDRVTSFAYGDSRNKGAQEYTIQPRSVCAKIPDNLSFEAAATIPDNFTCALYTVFSQLSLPLPTSFPAAVDPPLSNTPILVYGAGSTAGQYIIRLLHLARYKRIFVTASAKHHGYLRSLGATDLFDYNSPTLIDDINSAVGGPGKLTIAVDCISAQSTMGVIAKLLGPTGSVALLMPVKEGNSLNPEPGSGMVLDLPLPNKLNPFQKGTNIIGVRTFLYQADLVLKEKAIPVILSELLDEGLIEPTRYRVMDQGSLQQRAEQALHLLRTNQVSGEKIIVKMN